MDAVRRTFVIALFATVAGVSSGNGGILGINGSRPQAAGNQDVWVVVYAGSYQGGADTEILLTRSVDGTASWSAPAPLNIDWQTDNENDVQPTIAVSEDGTWVCAWQRKPGHIFTARSTDNGVTWSSPGRMDINDTTIHQTPSVASHGQGRWLLAYDDDTELLLRRSGDDGLTWGPPVTAMSDFQSGFCNGHSSYCATGEVEEPRVYASGFSDLIYVGFHYNSQSRLGGQPFFTTWEGGAGQPSLDGGATFPFFIVSGYAIPENKGSQQMATDGNGTWLLARTSSKMDPLYGPYTPMTTAQFGRATNDSVEFVNLPSGSPADNVVAADVAMDPEGDAVRIYTVSVPTTGGGFTYETKMSHSTDGGLTWGEETKVDMSHGSSLADPRTIRLVSNGQGQYLLVWQTTIGIVAFTAFPSTITTAADWILYQ